MTWVSQQNAAVVNPSSSFRLKSSASAVPEETWRGWRRHFYLSYSVSETAARLSTCYVNTTSDSTVNTERIHPHAQIDISHKGSPQSEPTVVPLARWGSAPRPSPVKPLRCGSVATHLFNHHSLACLSDSSRPQSSSQRSSRGAWPVQPPLS